MANQFINYTGILSMLSYIHRIHRDMANVCGGVLQPNHCNLQCPSSGITRGGQRRVPPLMGYRISRPSLLKITGTLLIPLLSLLRTHERAQSLHICIKHAFQEVLSRSVNQAPEMLFSSSLLTDLIVLHLL